MTYDRIYILSALQFFEFLVWRFHFSLSCLLFSIYFILLFFSSDLGALIPG